jgi:uncharacterized membrane protein YbhN (UPF0104 family)
MRRVTEKMPSWLPRAMQIAIGGALLVLLWQAADGRAALESLAGADPVWLIAAFAALSVQTILSALRWRLTAAQLGIRLGRLHALGEYYMAQLVNQSLPGGMIGDAGRAVRARGQAGLWASGQAVIFERLAGQVAMVFFLALGVLATLAVPGGLDWPAWLLWPTLTALALALLSPLALLGARRLPGSAGQGARVFAGSVHRALLDRDILPAQIGLSLGTALFNLAGFAFAAKAVGITLGLGAVAALVPLILLSMLIPLSVSGWGVREGTAAVLLPLAGVATSAALAASVAFGLVFIATALPGLAVLWLSPSRTGQTPAEAETGPRDAASGLARRGSRPRLGSPTERVS